MKKIAVVLIGVTLISKIIGFLRDIFLSYYYGASAISDVYIISLTIPGVIFAFIGSAISTSFVPVYTTISKNKDTKEADKFLNNLISTFFIICTLIILIIFIFTENFVELFAFGFDNETLKLAITFTRITVFGIYFSMLTHIYSSYLNIKKEYLGPAFMGIPFNIILICSIIISSFTSILILPFGILLSLIFQLIYLLIILKRKKYKYYFEIKLRDPHIKEIFILALPVILGVSVNQINILVDRTIASSITVGGISAINYSSKLNEFVIGLFVISILTIVYPRMANFSAENRIEELKIELINLLKFVNIIIIPFAVFIIFFSEEIILMLYGRGEFDDNAVKITSKLLQYYMVGLLAMAYREVISKAFYSIKDTKTPTINSIIGLSINIILNIYFTKLIGIGGLALATSISALITVILLIHSLPKKIGKLNITNTLISILKIISIVLITISISKLIFEFLLLDITNSIISLIIISLFYTLVILLLFKIFKFKEIDQLLNIFSIALSKFNKTNSKKK